MIALHKFAVVVKSEYELFTALEFYRLATGLPLACTPIYIGRTSYVGCWKSMWSGLTCIVSGNELCSNETAITFASIESLTVGSDERKQYLEQAKHFARQRLTPKNLDGEI